MSILQARLEDLMIPETMLYLIQIEAGTLTELRRKLEKKKSELKLIDKPTKFNESAYPILYSIERIENTINYYMQKLTCKCCGITKHVINMAREPSQPFGYGAGFLFCNDCRDGWYDRGTDLFEKCGCCKMYGCDKEECNKPDIKTATQEDKAFLASMVFVKGVRDER